MTLVFRDAVPGDAGLVHEFVHHLAAFERLTDEVEATVQDFDLALFGPVARCHAMFAEIDGVTVGFALWFYNFSTFQGRHGLYVEDVFVLPAHRGHGIGRALFQEMARRAVAQGCGRMQWSVLNWNSKAISFYAGLGARPLQEWTIQRLSGDALAELAQ